MNFPTSVATCFKKYADFSGRASRSEYWWFSILLAVPLIILNTNKSDTPTTLGFISGIAMLLLCIPSMAVTARRLHDTDRSGWLMLVQLIPFVGLLVLVWLCTEGGTGSNQYGKATQS